MNKDLSDEAKERFLREIGLCLKGAGFQTEPRKNGLLAVSWNGASLCRVNANGGAQFRKEELDAEGASEAFHRALNVTEQTVAYLRLMESAPTLKARGLDGDYRLLLDFNGTVLAAHATNNGAEFVTWEWDYDHTGMWQGHYYGSNYSAAKKDFCIRAGLISRNHFFEPEQLDELYRCCQWTRELDETLTYQDEQRIIKVQEQIELLVPGVQERVAAKEMQQQGSQIEQTMC